MSGNNKKNAFLQFLEKLYNPPSWVAVLAIATTLIVCPLVVLTVAFDYGHSLAAVIGCVICGFLLIYTVAVIVNYIVRLRKKVFKVADKFEWSRNFFKDYESRTLFFSIFNLLCNVGYTVFLVVMALVYNSIWYGTVGLYYILLIVARGGALVQNGKDEKQYKTDYNKLQTAKVGTYRYCAIMMLALALAMAVSVAELVIDSYNAGFRLPGWMIYVFGGVAAYKVITALVHFVRATKRDDFAVRAVRYINLSVTLMSVLCLQTAIVAAYPPKDMTAAVSNGITGAIVCLITFGLGLYMIVHSFKAKKRLLQQEAVYAEGVDELERGYNRDGYKEEYVVEEKASRATPLKEEIKEE